MLERNLVLLTFSSSEYVASGSPLIAGYRACAAGRYHDAECLMVGQLLSSSLSAFHSMTEAAVLQRYGRRFVDV